MKYMRVCRAAPLVLVLGCSAVWVARADEAAERKPVSFAILEDYDKGDDLDDVARDFALFEALEIRTWRGSFGWDDYEPVRGRFDFSWLHAFAERAAKHRIELRPYIGYTPEWAARRRSGDDEAWNNPPARPRDWERFAGALAGALARHPNVRSYEIYNEQNVPQWWDGSPEDYAGVLLRGARAIRGPHPRSTILFGGLVFPDLPWVEQVCRTRGAARAFSVLPVHAYPETWTPEGVTVENYLGGLPQFAAAVDRACGPKAIWINETGFATVAGKTETEQAHWWVRAVASFLATPRVEHIGVYEIKDLPADRRAIGDAPNYHLGLTKTDRTPKLAFHTVDLLTDLLDVGTLTVEDRLAVLSVADGSRGELHHHLFRRPDGERVLFVWDRSASPAVRVDIPGVKAVVEYQIDGRPLERMDAGALSRVRLAPGVPRIFRIM